MKLKDNLYTTNGWDIYERELDSGQIITTGSNFLIGNGYLGYRGTLEEWGKDHYTGCLVADTYDRADGKWTELCNVPNALFTDVSINNELDTKVRDKEYKSFERRLDLKEAILYRQSVWDDYSIKTERWASYHNKHLIGMRYVMKANKAGELILKTGIDSDVWSINGEHFKSYETITEGDFHYVHTITKEKEIDIYVGESVLLHHTPKTIETVKVNNSVIRKFTFAVQPSQEIILEKYMVIFTSNDVSHPKAETEKLLKESLRIGYEQLKSDHIFKWQELWGNYDIEVQDDLFAQTIIRFNLYHNIIATPTHGLLPIGARGLSCQAYQGSAFWDQEIFNMPMYLYTTPDIAKNILLYRYHTLDGARKKAKELGFAGAFYAWISGKTGQELCPSFFFKDVLTGREIRNHFNDWQIHISPDISYAIWKYYEATGDLDFILEYGAEMLFEIGIFLASRVSYNPFKKRYEFTKLLGPDEYHENVDNNLFTNYQARYAIAKALYIYEDLLESNKEKLHNLKLKIGLSDDIVNIWRDMEETIYIPEADPETKLIEQFDGYFSLEDIFPEQLAKRLQHPQEYWGWPNGIAVHTQVIKQADVIQLFVLHDTFDHEILKQNYDYYEPRTEHGSSLSPGMHAIIANRIGYTEKAYEYFIKASTVDLFNSNKAMSGGTFIGGIHTASAGAVWQMIVFGFAGLSIRDGMLHFAPSLPEKWESMKFKLSYQGSVLEITISQKSVNIYSDSGHQKGIDLQINKTRYRLEPSNHLRVELAFE